MAVPRICRAQAGALGICFVALAMLMHVGRMEGQSETVLYNFDYSNGVTPAGTPVLGADGNFYGVATGYGAYLGGTIFQMTPAGQITTLYNFGLAPDGYDPCSLVLGADGNFYGTTQAGGAGTNGTVFEFTPPSAAHPLGVYKSLYSFGLVSNVDGRGPMGVILGSDGNLYGTTLLNGPNGQGTVFKLVPATGMLTTLHSFDDLGGANFDGGEPAQNLVQGTDGLLYGTTSEGGSVGGNPGTVFSLSTSGSNYQVLHTFNTQPFDGVYDPSGLVEGPDGNFYGTTSGGGVQGQGTLFKITPQGVETVLYSFGNGGGSYVGLNPGSIGQGYTYGPTHLLLTKEGDFYGTTYTTSTLYGGYHGGQQTGTIFKLTPQGVATFLHNFSDDTVSGDGVLPQGVALGADGNLYGITGEGGNTQSFFGNGVGTFYKLTLGLPGLTSPLNPTGTVGTPFSYQIEGTYQPTSYAAAGLPAGLALNSATGLISGTPTTVEASGTTATLTLVNTSGSSNFLVTFYISAQAAPVITSPLTAYAQVNTPFTYTITATNYPVVYGATGLPAGLNFNASTGVVSGTVAAVTTGTVALSATNAVGSDNEPLTLQVSTDAPVLGQQYAVLHNFGDGSVAGDGAMPDDSDLGLVAGFDGNLYGTTLAGGNPYGGNYSTGTAFVLSPAGTEAVLHSFNIADVGIGGVYADGVAPYSLMQASDGNFYGITGTSGLEAGGVPLGTVFQVSPTGAEAVLHYFGLDPDVPNDGIVSDLFGGALTEGTDGDLYGTTEAGGTANGGVIFVMSRTGQYAILHDFGDGTVANDGMMPQSMDHLADGNFYGTTLMGGSAGKGTIFKMTPGGAVSVLHSFGDGSVPDEGTEPQHGLVMDAEGNLYGTTENGGTAEDGTVYVMNSMGQVTILHSFGAVAGDGESPEASLIVGFDGNLYGTTEAGGANGAGTVFQMTPGGAVTILESLGGGTNGVNPRAPVIEAADGNFYGVTGSGGSNNQGTVFTIIANQQPAAAPVAVGPAQAALYLRVPGAYRLLTEGVATSWSVTGSLPQGMTLDGTTGLIAGVPTMVGTSSFSLTARNGAGQTVTPVTLVVYDVPAITSPKIATGFAGGPFFYQIAGTGLPYQFGAGILPDGLSADPSTGIISGTPTTVGTSSTIYPTATNPAGTGEGTLVIEVSAQMNQTIKFPALGGAAYGETIPLGATASSGLPITYSVVSGPATVAGSSVTFTGVGTVKLAADQAGDASFTAAAEARQSVSVVKATQSIYGGTVSGYYVLYTPTPYGITLPIATSGLPVTVSVLSGPAMLSGSTITLTGTGTVKLAEDQAGNADYAAAPELTNSFTVYALPKLFQVIFWDPFNAAVVVSGSFVYEGFVGQTVTSPAVVLSGLPITYSVVPTAGYTGAATISGSNITFTSAGKITLAANQAGNATYSPAAQSTFTMTILPGNVIAPFKTIATKTAGDAPFNITVPADSDGLPVTVTVQSGPASISGSTVTITGPGTVVLAANVSAFGLPLGYPAAAQVTTSFVVNPSAQLKAQTIGPFAAITAKTYGGAPFGIAAPKASSGLPVTVSVLSGPAAIAGTTITTSGTGTVVLAANQPGSASFAAAPQVTTSFVINQAAQTIAPFAVIPAQTYDGVNFFFNIAVPAASSGLPVTVTVLSGSAGVEGNLVEITGTGTVELAANQAGNADYMAAPQVTTSFVLSAPVKMAQTITFFGAIADRVYSQKPFNITVPTASSGLPVSVKVLFGPATFSGKEIRMTGAGLVFLAANQAGNATYAAAPEVTTSFIIFDEQQTIGAFAPIPNQTYGGAPFSITPPKDDSGLPVTVTVLSGPAIISGNTIKMTGTGTVVLAANQEGNSMFAPAAQVTTSFVVSQVSQTIAPFGPIAGQIYNGIPIVDFTVAVPKASSGLPVTLSVLSGSAGIVYNGEMNITGTGTVVLAANQAGNAIYAPAPQVTTSFVVTPPTIGSQTIAPFAAVPTQYYSGLAAVDVTVAAPKASSGLPVTVSVLSGPATVIYGGVINITGVGTVVLAANQAGDTNFAAAAQVTTSFQVTPPIPVPQTIAAFPAIPAKTFGGAPFSVPAPAANSGLPVTVTVQSGPVAIVGGYVYINGAGTVVLAANQAGNAFYLAAKQVTTSFVVNKAPQNIPAFPSLPNINYADSFGLSLPTVDSGLPVAVTVQSGPAVITDIVPGSPLDGITITPTGVGTVVLAESQAGDANYAAAPTETVSFAVTKAPQTLTPWVPIPTLSYTVMNQPFPIPTSSSGLTVKLSVVSGPATLTGNVLQLTGTGTVVLAASQAGNADYLPATTETTSFKVVSGTVGAIVRKVQTKGMVTINN